jgi:hypothetical protein
MPVAVAAFVVREVAVELDLGEVYSSARDVELAAAGVLAQLLDVLVAVAVNCAGEPVDLAALQEQQSYPALEGAVVLVALAVLAVLVELVVLVEESPSETAEVPLSVLEADVPVVAKLPVVVAPAERSAAVWELEQVKHSIAVLLAVAVPVEVAVAQLDLKSVLVERLPAFVGVLFELLPVFVAVLDEFLPAIAAALA